MSYKRSFNYNENAKKGAIRCICCRYKNGMREDIYTVYYENGYTRKFTICGEMNQKHFDVVMNPSKIVTKYFKRQGRTTKAEWCYA